MSTKLEWQGDNTTDGRFAIQTEHARGEGVCYFLFTPGERRVYSLSYVDSDIARAHNIETDFYGRGGKAKVKAAAQRIADLTEDS